MTPLNLLEKKEIRLMPVESQPETKYFCDISALSGKERL
jgi:hypothetical protein